MTKQRYFQLINNYQKKFPAIINPTAIQFYTADELILIFETRDIDLANYIVTQIPSSAPITTTLRVNSGLSRFTDYKTIFDEICNDYYEQIPQFYNPPNAPYAPYPPWE